MSYNILFFLMMLSFCTLYSEGCLITNCPNGGKRSSSFGVADKGCISCGPGLSGRCLGSSICCGPFGCLIGTVETQRCKRLYIPDGVTCELSGLPCKENTGKCMADGICCTHDACHIDKQCNNVYDYIHDSVPTTGMQFYKLMNTYETLSDNVKQ